eukprot:3897031-Pyramimonas_sp.AAC.1
MRYLQRRRDDDSSYLPPPSQCALRGKGPPPHASLVCNLKVLALVVVDLLLCRLRPPLVQRLEQRALAVALALALRVAPLGILLRGDDLPSYLPQARLPRFAVFAVSLPAALSSTPSTSLRLLEAPQRLGTMGHSRKRALSLPIPPPHASSSPLLA